MTIRVQPAIVLLAAGLALSGCIDIECPAEYARPISRERFCGRTGDVGGPVTYKPTVAPMVRASAAPAPAPVVVAPPPGPPIAAPAPSVSVEPMAPPPAGGPTQIR